MILVQMDLGGTLPTAVTNLAAQSQPMVLVTLRSLLDREYSATARPDMSSSLPPRYEGPSFPPPLSPVPSLPKHQIRNPCNRQRECGECAAAKEAKEIEARR